MISKRLKYLRISKKAGLKEYKSKRDFHKTPEPEGTTEAKNKYRFVIQRHKAEKAGTHLDLRLENDQGTLSSWALPKNKLPNKDEKVLAVKTEDHPVEYINFGKDKKEKIETGYGKGSVEVFETGKYKPIESKKNKIKFEIASGKSKGKYALIHTSGQNWLLIKM